MAELTYRDAVARGIAQEMARDPDVVWPTRKGRVAHFTCLSPDPTGEKEDGAGNQ